MCCAIVITLSLRTKKSVIMRLIRFNSCPAREIEINFKSGTESSTPVEIVLRFLDSIPSSNLTLNLVNYLSSD